MDIKIKPSGFTLVETAMVMLILGLMLAGAVVAIKQWEVRRYMDEVDRRVGIINEALIDYVQVHSRFPCVASANIPRNDPEYGKSTDCAASAVGGTVSVQNPDRGNRAVRIGAVPVRELNISNEYIADPKGHLFTYAVTEVLVTGTFDNSLGAIDIIDENGTSVLTPEGAGLYVVLSHGRDGRGAYYYDGASLTSTCTTALGMDQENCDNDYTFRAAQYNTAVSSPDYFDDRISYSAYVVPNCGISGEVFDGTRCVPAQGTGRGGYTVNLDGSCRYRNAYTNLCQCPADYASFLLLRFDNPSCTSGFYSDNIRTSNCGVATYLCMKM